LQLSDLFAYSVRTGRLYIQAQALILSSTNFFICFAIAKASYASSSEISVQSSG
jgi:hypothetical protein